MIKVSIIIATFNAEKTLAKCLDSILQQTFLDREIIIIDGDSKDGTRNILETYAPYLAYWCSEPDAGIYDAWNKGISRATGEWITFLGADDCWHGPEALQALVDLTKDDLDFVSARARLLSSNHQQIKVIGAPWNWKQMLRYQNIAHPGALHHRRLFDQLGHFDTSYRIAGDYEFLLRMPPETKTAHLDRITVDFSAGGASNTQITKVLRETRLIQSKHQSIGVLLAWKNYFIALAKAQARNLVCRN